MNLMLLPVIRNRDTLKKITIIMIVLTVLCINVCLASSISDDYPNVVGKHQTDAEKILIESNTSYLVVYDICEGCKERYVFDQIANGSKLTLFVNKRLDSLTIEDKMNNFAINLSENERELIYTNSTVVVNGFLISDLKDNEHIWIAVNPQTSIDNWWPQSKGDIKPYNREFKGNAFLGGRDQAFDIAVLIVNDTLNQILADWEIHSAKEQSWPPITEGDPVTGEKIPKNAIENAILIKVRAFLK